MLEKWTIDPNRPYSVAIEVITEWAYKNFFDNFLVTFDFDGEIETEILIHEEFHGFVWLNDWWEGQKSITMLGFIPASHTFYLGEPEMNRRFYYVVSDPEEGGGEDG